MPSPEDDAVPDPAGRSLFPATRWTDLMRAQKTGSPEAREALERLCGTYWFPLYAFVRRSGYTPPDAEDLTQSFFYVLLEKNYLGALDRTRGKFRSFLLAALGHFLLDHRKFMGAAKRGGGRIVVSRDQADPEHLYLLEPVSDLSPEKVFDRGWAQTLIQEATAALAEEYRAKGKGELFGHLKAYLATDPEEGEYAALGERLGVPGPSVAVAVHRLRQRYRALVRGQVAATVASPQEVDDEMRHLIELLGASGLQAE